MLVKLTILGIPEITATEKEAVISGRTLAELAEEVRSQFPDKFPNQETLLAFVNGQAAPEGWADLALNEEDHVMLVVPISGG